VPGFEQLLAANDADMQRFYQAAELISKRPKPDRHEELRILARTRVTKGKSEARKPKAEVQTGAGVAFR